MIFVCAGPVREEQRRLVQGSRNDPRTINQLINENKNTCDTRRTPYPPPSFQKQITKSKIKLSHKKNLKGTMHSPSAVTMLIKHHRKTNPRQVLPNTMLQNRPQARARSYGWRRLTYDKIVYRRHISRHQARWM